MIHHQLLGHGLASQALRAGHGDIEVGIALNLEPRVPRSDHPLDRDAAAFEEGLMNRWFLDPLLVGRYPDDLAALTGWPASVVADGDLGHHRPAAGRCGTQLLPHRGGRVSGPQGLRPAVTVEQASCRGDRDGLAGDTCRSRPDAADAGRPRCRGGLCNGERSCLPGHDPGRRDGRRPGPSLVSGAPPRRSRPLDRRRRSAAGLLSPGPCWTISSGASATRAASAWSMSITSPSAAHRRARPTGTGM